jgi:hypothetical protein
MRESGGSSATYGSQEHVSVLIRYTRCRCQTVRPAVVASGNMILLILMFMQLWFLGKLASNVRSLK